MTNSATPILLMARELGPGGTERQLTEMARSLDRSRFRVHVGCFRPGFREDELASVGIDVVRLPVTSFLNLSAIRGAWKLLRYFRRNGIQIVHTFDFPLNCFGPFVARFARIPTILTSQRAHRGLTPPLYLKLLRMTDRFVDGIVVNSQAVLTDMVENERVPASKLHLCYNGIDTHLFHPNGRVRQPEVESAELVIGVVCVLRPEKGLPALLQAFARVFAIRPGIRLLIVGSGPELPSLEDLARELGISAVCIFEPATRDVAPWLRSIDIFVLPSLSEALSNSLMEAMACGCACIASHTGGNPELIQEGETGLLFETGNAASLAEKLALLLEAPALRAQFAAAAVRRVENCFSLQASVSRMQEIYRQLSPLHP